MTFWVWGVGFFLLGVGGGVELLLGCFGAVVVVFFCCCCFLFCLGFFCFLFFFGGGRWGGGGGGYLGPQQHASVS